MDVILDAALFSDRKTLHDHVARALSFPDWYGGNLDALFDCLTSLPEETSLTIEHWAEAEAALGPYAARVRRVLEDAHRETEKLTLIILE